MVDMFLMKVSLSTVPDVASFAPRCRMNRSQGFDGPPFHCWVSAEALDQLAEVVPALPRLSTMQPVEFSPATPMRLRGSVGAPFQEMTTVCSTGARPVTVVT